MRTAVLVFVVALGGCSSHKIVDPVLQTDDGGAIDPTIEAGVSAAFPKDPIITGGAPSDAADQFANGAEGGSDGPCMIEPSQDAMYPKNWIHPRFRWSITHNETLFEIRMHVANQMNDLIVYTAKKTWTMDDQIWTLLRDQSNDLPIDVKVRSLENGTIHVGTKEQVSIAPVDAPGSVVYWTTASGGSAFNATLKGFTIGNEKISTVLTPPQVNANNACVACHTSTPDGKYVGVNLAPSNGGGGWATADLRSIDGKATQPSFITQAAKDLLARPMTQLPIFSKSHWQDGDHVMGATYQNTSIIWLDLEAQSSTGWGVFARTGDSNKPAMAAFSHDGTEIVYTSTADPSYGAGCIIRSGELRKIPYNNRKGGDATPIAGSHAQGFMEYYASFSPDDRFLSFTRAPEDPTTSYDNPKSESYVVSAAGGSALRLAANDPPSCMNVASPGITNAWPKWSPQVLQSNGRSFYFLIFSSRRDAAFLDANSKPRPQLYVTTVIDDGKNLTSTGALYVGNQPSDESNHTPAWDAFDPSVIH